MDKSPSTIKDIGTFSGPTIRSESELDNTGVGTGPMPCHGSGKQPSAYDTEVSGEN